MWIILLCKTKTMGGSPSQWYTSFPLFRSALTLSHSVLLHRKKKSKQTILNIYFPFLQRCQYPGKKPITAWQHPHCCALEKTPTLQLLSNVTSKNGLWGKQIPGPFVTPTAQGNPSLLHEANPTCSEKWKLYIRRIFTVSSGLPIKKG